MHAIYYCGQQYTNLGFMTIPLRNLIYCKAIIASFGSSTEDKVLFIYQRRAKQQNKKSNECSETEYFIFPDSIVGPLTFLVEPKCSRATFHIPAPTSTFKHPHMQSIKTISATENGLLIWAGICSNFVVWYSFTSFATLWSLIACDGR